MTEYKIEMKYRKYHHFFFIKRVYSHFKIKYTVYIIIIKCVSYLFIQLEFLDYTKKTITVLIKNNCWVVSNNLNKNYNIL